MHHTPSSPFSQGDACGCLGCCGVEWIGARAIAGLPMHMDRPLVVTPTPHQPWTAQRRRPSTCPGPRGVSAPCSGPGPPPARPNGTLWPRTQTSAGHRVAAVTRRRHRPRWTRWLRTALCLGGRRRSMRAHGRPWASSARRKRASCSATRRSTARCAHLPPACMHARATPVAITCCALC